MAHFVSLSKIQYVSLSKVTCLGINVKSILKMAIDADIADDQKRKSTIKTLAKYMEDSLGIAKELSINGTIFKQFLHCRSGKNVNTYLTSLYIFVKALYMANVVGQFFLLNQFLGTNYSFWGVQILADLARGREWQDSGTVQKNKFLLIVSCRIKKEIFQGIFPELLYATLVFANLETSIDIPFNVL